MADELLGTWVFKDEISAISTAEQSGFILTFNSNGKSYVGIGTAYIPALYIGMGYFYKLSNPPDAQKDSDQVYDSEIIGNWTDKNFKTITITDASNIIDETGAPAREQFTTWLKANATKQTPAIDIYFREITIKGKKLNLANGGKPVQFTYAGVTYKLKEDTKKLASPQNATYEGTTVSFDEVENAGVYDILIDGVKLGEISATTYNVKQEGTNIQVNNVPIEQQGGNLRIL